METPVLVGIDSSDDHHDVHATADPGGEDWIAKIGNDLTAFYELLAGIEQRWPGRAVRFGIENPNSLLGRFLVLAGHSVYAVNPRSVCRARDTLTSSGKKDDALDARTINLVLRERGDTLAPVIPDSPQGRLLAGLVEHRVALLREKTRLMNQLTAVLKGFYPRALELFSHLDQPLTLQFLEAFPSPSRLVAAEKERFMALFAGAHYPRPRKIGELWDQALKPQVPIDPIEERLGTVRAGDLTRMLRLALAAIERTESEIQQAFDNHPDAGIYRSLPGAARVLGPALLTLFGDTRSRWRSAQHIATYTGAAPVTRQSGRKRTVSMRRHCSHEARRVLHLFANCSRRRCPWAQAFYEAQRVAGKTHAAALRNLAIKWIRIIYRIWQEGGRYDPNLYLDALARHASPYSSAPATSA